MVLLVGCLGARPFVATLTFRGVGVCAARCALLTGTTPLCIAIQNGRTKAMELLLAANADVGWVLEVRMCCFVVLCAVVSRALVRKWQCRWWAVRL